MYKYEQLITELFREGVTKHYVKDNVLTFIFPEEYHVFTFYDDETNLIADSRDCKGEVFYKLVKVGTTYDFIDLEEKRTINSTSDLKEAIIDFVTYLDAIIE